MNRKPNSKQLSRLRQLVTCDPEIMRGTPVFKGTRIPVDLVADMLAQGATADEIRDGYPTLSDEMLSLAPLWGGALRDHHPNRWAASIPTTRRRVPRNYRRKIACER